MRPRPAAVRFQVAPNAVRVAGPSPRHASAPPPAVGSVPVSNPATRLFAALLLLPHLSPIRARSEEHTSELQSQSNLVCRLLLEKKKAPSSLRSTLMTRGHRHSVPL